MKRVIAFCVFLTVLSTILIVRPVRAEEEAIDMDCLGKLASLGIVSSEEFAVSSEGLTKGAFVKYIVRMLGIGIPELEPPRQQVFSDVPVKHENAGYINAAYEMGFVSGDDGYFYPEERVTKEQAYKLLVSVLGYDVLAKRDGGFPEGYLKTAKRIGIYEETGTILSADVLMAAQGVRLLVAALETDVLRPVSLGGEDSNYSIEKGRTLLWESFEVRKARGIVEANEYTDLLTPESGTGENNVLIGGALYCCGTTDAAGFLGISTEFYYRDSTDQKLPAIVYIGALANQNRILSLRGKDLSQVTASQISYDQKSGRNLTLRLDPLVTMIWNGRMTAFSIDRLETSKENIGQITLIDHDSDGSYEVIKVMCYTPLVVQGVSQTEFTVSAEGGDFVRLEPNNPDYAVQIFKDGEAASFDMIQSGQVLSCAVSEGAGRNLKTVLISSRTVSGTVQYLDDEEIQVDGVTCEVRKELIDKIQVGQTGTFYIDAFGIVVDKRSAAQRVYGFLNGLNAGQFGLVQCRIYTENARWVTLDFRDKLKYNGKSGVTAATAAELIRGTEAGPHQLVAYRVDEDGKIMELNTAQTFPAWSDEERAAIENGTFRLTASFSSTTYRAPTRSFDAVVSLEEDAKIFVVPEDTGREEEFTMIKDSALQGDITYASVSVYDADRMRVAPVCVMRALPDMLTTPNLEDSFLVVDFACRVADPDGGEVDAVSGYYRGANLTVKMKDDEVLKDIKSNLRQGDILWLNYDPNGKVDQVKRLFSAANGTEQKIDPGNLYNKVVFAGGRVQALSSALDRLILEYGNGLYGGLALSQSLRTVYLYEPARKLVSIGSSADIREGDYVFVFLNYFHICEIMVIKTA